MLFRSRIAGIGLIRACVDKPDGSSNLILQGVSRVRFTDFVLQRHLLDPGR